MSLKTQLRRIAAIGGIETISAVAGGLVGLLIVNVLPKEQYAQYSFLVACMTLMLGVTNMGLAHCCLPVVGERAHDVPWVVGVCQRVFHWRWALLGAGLLVVLPYWGWTTRAHGWWSPGYVLGSVAVALQVLFTLREQFGGTVLVILRHLRALYKVNIVTLVARMGLTFFVLALPLGGYSVAGVLAATTLASLTGVWMYRDVFGEHRVPRVRMSEGVARRVDRETLRIARPLVLPEIFYLVQGSATVFLGALFGSTDILAQVGAFTRLAMVLLVVERLATVLLFPLLARAPDGPKLVSTVLRVHGLYLLAMAAVEVSAILLPQWWIILLGSQYRSLAPYVWMVVLAALLMNAGGVAFRTLTVRGATAKQGWGIGATLAAQTLYLWIFGASSLPALLGFNLATACAHFGFQYLMLARQLPRWGRPRQQPSGTPESP